MIEDNDVSSLLKKYGAVKVGPEIESKPNNINGMDDDVQGILNKYGAQRVDNASTDTLNDENGSNFEIPESVSDTAKIVGSTPLRLLNQPQAIAYLVQEIKKSIGGEEGFEHDPGRELGGGYSEMDITDPSHFVSEDITNKLKLREGKQTTKFKIDPEDLVQNIAERYLKEHAGIDLHVTPSDNMSGRIAQNALEFGLDTLAGGWATNAAQKTKYIPEAWKVITKAFFGSGTSSKAVGKAAAVGAGSQALQETGLDPLSSTLIAASVGPAINSAKGPARAALSKADLSKNKAKEMAYDEASSYLKNAVGEKDIPGVVEKIDNYKPAFEGYEPLTSDVARDVGVAKVHAAHSGPNGILAKRGEENINTLRNELENIASDEFGGQATKDFVKDVRDAESAALTKETEGIRSNLDAETTKKVEALESRRNQLEQERIKIEEKVAKIEQEALSKKKEAVSEFDKTASAEETGEAIQDFVKSKVRAIRKNASKETEQLFLGGYAEPFEIQPKRTKRYITNELQKHSGAIKSDLEEAWKHVMPEEVGSKLTDTEKLHYGVQSLYAMREKIPPHERSRRRILGQVIKAAEGDLSKSKKLGEARKAYKDLVQGANVIEENSALKKVIAKSKNTFSREFAMSQGDVPKSLIQVSGDPVGARELFKQIKDNRPLRDRVKHYINKVVIDNFVGSDGKVKVDNFNRWKHANKGAFELYPGLDSKLDNLQDAQRFVDDITKQNKKMKTGFDRSMKTELRQLEKQTSTGIKTAEKTTESAIKDKESAFKDKYSGVDEKILNAEGKGNVASAILDGKSKIKTMREAIKLAKQDKTGGALKGLQRDTLEHFKSKLGDNFTYKGFEKYIATHGAALNDLFGEESMGIIHKIKGELEGKHATTTKAKDYGSNTTSKTVTLSRLDNPIITEISGKATSKIPFWDGFKKRFEALKSEEKKELVIQALLEPKKFKEMITSEAKKAPSLREELKKAKSIFGERFNKLPKGLLLKGQEKQDR